MDPIFQFTDLSTHVQNCSSDECILPTCVNWKLNVAKTSHKQLQQHKKREWSTTVSDVRHKKEKLQHDKEIDEATALFFEDLEELMKGDLGKTLPSCLATDIDAKNSFYVSQNIPGCNQLHIAADNDVELILNSQQKKGYEFAESPSDTELAMVPTGISPDQLTGSSLKTQSYPLEMEKLFIPFGDFPYQRPSSRMTATAAPTKGTEELPFFCSLRDSKLPQEDENKLKNQASLIQPTNAKRLWGILAQILKMIEEGSVSEDSEAFCVKVLQKALAELQLRFLPQK
ncbi:uncharacterized protein LOC122959974 [Acropora millepora]|uniref:uncharacterized protein LOC122959974 n=1 Tax=Acropora millepora TaxID=45264 RepID=UPI001CF2080D|nr:uncharacterized protein LOC122959974 [Acropora millepora]